MIIKPICPYSFGANTYALISDGKAFVVDPCASAEAIISAVKSEGAEIVGILLTHGHFDHTVALDTLRAATNVPAYIHKNDAIMLTDGKKDAFFTFYGRENKHKPADHTLEDGDVLTLGDESIRVIHTPGHTAGCVCFACKDFLVTGDTLFAQSIGRCDLWSSDENQMRDSLALLRTLDPNITIYPGHAEPAKLGHALDNAAFYL